MTTIAYRDGVMAADSKCSDEWGAFSTRCRKIARLGSGALLGQAGDADGRDVIRLLDGCKTEKSLPSRKALADTHCEFAGILVLPRGSIWYIDITCIDYGPEVEWSGSVMEVHEAFAAVGSGYQFAIGAMASGRSAAQAVAIACRYDIKSGPPVHAVALKPETKRDRQQGAG